MIDFAFLKSKTFWTLIIIFVINGFSGIRENIPATWLPLIDFVLTGLGVWFHVNPKQQLTGFVKKQI